MNRRGFISSAVGAAAGASAVPLAAAAQEAAAGAKGLNLKITGLKTFAVSIGGGNWIFCKVYTNQGLVGLGEGTVNYKTDTIMAAIMEHERFLIGQDPTDIEYLYQAMFRYPRWRGGPVLNSAISAVEIALWDILGQALGVPIYKLLGGAARKRIRMYIDIPSTPEAFLKAKEMGYTAGKSGFMGIKDGLIDPHSSVREGVRQLDAVRKAVGDDFDIMIDAHGHLTTTMAIDYCNRVFDLRPKWVEEPTQLEDLGELALLRQKTNQPLATGERSFTKYGFKDFCSQHLVDYIQPDICHAGGILEMKKIGVLAETYRIEMAPHNPQSQVSTMASLHVDATTPACTIQESSPHTAQWITDMFQGTGAVVKDGYAELPSKPGLGVTIDDKIAAQHPYKPMKFDTLYHFSDGSVGDP
jgi:galactonate dehydratase